MENSLIDQKIDQFQFQKKLKRSQVVLYSNTSLLFLAASGVELYGGIKYEKSIRIVSVNLKLAASVLDALTAYVYWKQYKKAAS